MCLRVSKRYHPRTDRNSARREDLAAVTETDLIVGTISLNFVESGNSV